VYLSAEEEETQSSARLMCRSKRWHFVEERIKVRFQADYPIVEPEKIDLMDVGPIRLLQ
jgi:DNA-directed RNA polymerase subunit beta